MAYILDIREIRSDIIIIVIITAQLLLANLMAS